MLSRESFSKKRHRTSQKNKQRRNKGETKSLKTAFEALPWSPQGSLPPSSPARLGGQSSTERVPCFCPEGGSAAGARLERAAVPGR